MIPPIHTSYSSKREFRLAFVSGKTKNAIITMKEKRLSKGVGWLALATLFATDVAAAPATLLFEENFNATIPGWTAVLPPGAYIDGPMRWQYDIVNKAFFENSNIYTENAAGAPNAVAAMMINTATVVSNFTYKARLTAGDDDAFGLIFGYTNPTNFFRVSFSRQLRTANAFPWNGWNVDRMVNSVATNLFGDGADGVADPAAGFINTQYVPFDVTIGVTNGQFSLTVVDDPLNAATEHRLVEGQPLTGVPNNGRVGLFNWGQAGTLIAGFRAQDLSLAPTALAGNLTTLLTNWTPVIPLRANGTGLDGGALDDGMGNGFRAVWSLAMNENGPLGTLHENSDALGGNDPEGQIDFTGPTIVAGDTNWTDYLMTARIISGDDDGHGIILRYLDSSNFYRIALRAQTSATGVREGLSIQKVVNGVWEEVYFDETVRFDPPNNVPYDISALIIGDRLEVRVTANPTGAPQIFNYGPFMITGATVPKGKVGFFSWGMNPPMQVDFVRVHGIDGIPLQVTSAFGSPTPAAGLHGFTPGSSVTASVGSPVENPPGVRRVATGWRGTGSIPATGTGTNVSFTLNEFSEIEWDWTTEVRLDVTSGAGGQVNAPANGWLPEGTNLTVTAQPSAGYVFAGWTGTIASGQSTLNLRLNRPFTLEARFEADSDGDSLADSWEQLNFGSLSATASADADNDGSTNQEEFLRGTSPIASETMVLENALTSRWENVQRDPALPGQMVVRDYGAGFRGAWENSNDFREAEPANAAAPNVFVPADQIVPNVSFEGPRMIIASHVWQSAWSNYTASAVYDFGDNDAGTLYFRYGNESNWYRATIVAENNGATWRAPFGLSVQKRSNGIFSEMGRNEAIAGDPADTSFYKRIRLTITANGPVFTVTATGWNANATPPAWDTASEGSVIFTDQDHPTGRVGIGFWGQSGGSTAQPSNPVAAGMLTDNVTVSVNGAEVFREEFETTPLAAELPTGWIVPMTATAAGTWQSSAHGSIIQTGGFAPATTGTISAPSANADTSLLVSPAFEANQYFVELGLHPFDDDGIGFVYDYQDTNNFGRVMFASEANNNARIPQGVSVTRRSAGAWTDVIAGDHSFVYTPGQPFMVELARTANASRMTLWEVDRPENRITFNWAETAPASETNRIGFASWGQQDAHFTSASGLRIQSQAPPANLRITSMTRTGNQLQMQIENPGNGNFDVEGSTTLQPGSWTPVASNQTGTSFTTQISGERMFYRLVRR